MSSTEKVEAPLNFLTRIDAVHVLPIKGWASETWRSALFKHWCADENLVCQSLFVGPQEKSWMGNTWEQPVVEPIVRCGTELHLMDGNFTSCSFCRTLVGRLCFRFKVQLWLQSSVRVGPRPNRRSGVCVRIRPSPKKLKLTAQPTWPNLTQSQTSFENPEPPPPLWLTGLLRLTCSHWLTAEGLHW